MIKENKKNKIITFLCACLMVCVSAFGLVQAVGTTLASSALFPTINSDSFNYKQENFLNNFDDIIVSSNILISTSASGSNRWDFTLYYGNVIPFDYEPDSWYMYFLNNDLTISEFYYGGASSTGITGVHFYNDGTFSFLNNRSYLNKLPYQLLTQPTILVFEIDYINYTICNNILYREHVAWSSSDSSGSYDSGYNAGLQDGYTEGYEEGELEGYENGYQEGVDFGYDQGVTQGQNNVINNPNNYDLYTQAQYEQNYLNGQNSVINNPSAYGLYTRSEYDTNYINGYTAGQQYGYNLGYTEGQQDGYNLGYVDGEHSSGGYQNGFNDGFIEGQQDVLNNPNLHGLYTLAQYEQNYQDGYTQGVLSAQYGVFANVRISGGFAYQLTDDTVYSVSINNEDFNFVNGVISAKQSLIDKYNTFIELLSQQSNVRFKYARIIFNDLNFIYNSDIDINFVNLNSLNETSTAYFYANVNDSDNYLFRTYTPVLENGIVVGFNTGNFDNVIDGSLVTEITYDMLVPPPVVNDSVIGNYSLKPNNLLIYEKSIAFDNGYDVGYADGTNSEVVNNAYDKGYTDGNRVGYQTGLSEGLNNPNRYTFLGLLTGVISAPVNVLKDLFDFEILGFNMLKFFLGCFTAVLILWIIQKIMGGK